VTVPLLNALPRLEPPSPLFHYTSQRGVLGILGKATLWASSIHHLNDSSEFQYALDLLRETVGHRHRESTGSDALFLAAVSATLEQVRHVPVYVASFSEEPDLLSQWRAYCPVNGGYSLGFSITRLRAAVKGPPYRVLPCLYERPEQFQLIDELLQPFLPIASTHHFVPSLTLPPEQVAANAFLREFLPWAPVLKHEAFQEESEWRLIADPLPLTDDAVLFREGRSSVIPYVEYTLERDSESLVCDRIVVGPTPSSDLAVSTITDILIHHGAHSVPVSRSRIPYRPW
jgi:hypothetical protein